MRQAFAWTDEEVRRALDLGWASAEPDMGFERVRTDSRSVREGDLFVALVGDRFDGHDFVVDALASGARGAVVARPVAGAEGARLYPVDDTLEALGRLARHRRLAHSARVVGITGSSGKTTTKELTRGALETTFRVHANPGNLNNRIGLPLTLLDAPGDAQVMVLEMGSNEPGEIAALTGVAEPEIGVVTTVAPAHLEGLKSLEGVYREKLSLLEGLTEGGRAVVGDEPAELPRRAREVCPSVTVAGWGEQASADVRPEGARPDAQGRYTFRWGNETVSLKIPGRHAVQNALLALAVARMLGVEPEDAARGVQSVEPLAMRSEIRKLGRLTLLVDCYNANPQSVKAAVDLLESLPDGGGKVAVVGTMLELGTESAPLHRAVLEDVVRRGLDLVVATGQFAAAARGMDEAPGTAALLVAEDPESGYRELRPRLRGTETILLKASRGVALERIVPSFERDFGTGEA